MLLEAVPVDASLATETVPDAKFVAFKEVSEAPEPMKPVAETTPVPELNVNDELPARAPELLN